MPCPFTHLSAQESTKMKGKLLAGHPIHTLMCEHDMILEFLNALENIEKKKNFFSELSHIAEHLSEAELHHRREEEALFPELEKYGITGPTEVMRMEHTVLRQAKKKLLNLSEKAEKMDAKKLQNELKKISQVLIPELRQHIAKENQVLYPTALQVISNKKEWDSIKKACDTIGYCCFTPIA